ncbi:MAG: DNRLRE domain-containing protein [Candidatus Sumerlaeaceae bacterium]
MQLKSKETLKLMAIAMCLFACGSASCVTATFSGSTVTEDATLYSDNTSSNNGGGPTAYVGATESHGLRHMLLRFNVASIPSNASVTSVSLAMLMTKAPATGPSPTPQRLHRVTRAWTEGTSTGTGANGLVTSGTATWSSAQLNTTAWTTPGGDFVAGSSATTNIGSLTFSTFTWSSATMVADVQGWVTNAAQNFGWIVIGDEATQKSAREYASSEGAVSDQPVLTVTYTAVISAVRDWQLFN